MQCEMPLRVLKVDDGILVYVCIVRVLTPGCTPGSQAPGPSTDGSQVMAPRPATWA